MNPTLHAEIINSPFGELMQWRYPLLFIFEHTITILVKQHLLFALYWEHSWERIGYYSFVWGKEVYLDRLPRGFGV
jgi:hypothetical protein